MGTRRDNEKKFDSWKSLPTGGRQYRLRVSGRSGWFAFYFKEVDSEEHTLHFWQEIYDAHGKLFEVHEKFPVDKGHRKV
jgi:hypothetical protein